MMGDGRQHVIQPRTMPVRVGRRGTQVVLSIGNADPRLYSYADAMRLGMDWLREGARAKRQKRPAELVVHHHNLHCAPRTAREIAGWIMAKAAEAKFLVGDKQQVQVG
jgi:hypothetical protein